MPNNSEQKVVVLCDFTEQMKDVIVHGARMADILKKELCLLAFWKDKAHRIQVLKKIEITTHNLRSNLPDFPISNLILCGSLKENIEKMVNEYETVLMVLHQTNIKIFMRAFRESSIPFLFVSGTEPDYLRYKNVLVPVDYRKASKDTSLWASYFGRFNKSQIHVVYAHETNTYEAERVTINANFFKKFLSSLYVHNQLIPGKSSSWGIVQETLSRAKEWEGDSMIFSGSSSITLIDLLIGLPEKKIVRQAGPLPVMLINPRKDICMMCD
jgi:hypothetical protein